MAVRILTGHVLDVLATLPAESVHCVVTSPPYWGLRDYKVAPVVMGGDPACDHDWGAEGRKGGGAGKQGKGGQRADRASVPEQAMAEASTGTTCSHCGAWRGQIGLEPTPERFVANMVEVFRAVRRVLRPDGTLWLNMGDCYATGAGLKPKDLVGIPWRLAFALQADGWWLRQEIIWSKPNPMPESVTDRCTKAHEHLFLLTKAERYYFDQDAILEDTSPNTHARLSLDVQAQIGSDRANAGNRRTGNMKAVTRHGGGNRSHKGETAYREGAGEHRTKEGLVKFSAKMRKRAEAGSGIKNNDSMDAALAIMPLKRNKRSVWTVATEPFSEAHFATFPPKLIEPCILAGTSEKGSCTSCGAPLERRKVRHCEKCGAEVAQQAKSCGACGHVRNWKAGRTAKRELVADDWSTPGRGVPRLPGGFSSNSFEAGWGQTCACHPTPSVPCTVLDPFGGAGTTGLVADRLGRNAILIELSEQYTDMARRRIRGDAPLLAEVS